MIVRPRGERRFGGGDRGFKPYGEHRGEGQRDGERREYQPRSGGPRDRFDDRRDQRPQGRDFGDRPQSRGFGRPDQGGERREYQPRSGGPAMADHVTVSTTVVTSVPKTATLAIVPVAAALAALTRVVSAASSVP